MYRLARVAAAATLIVWTSAQAQAPAADSATQFLTGSEDYEDTVKRFLSGDVDKVVGGRLASMGAHPWQVSLAVSWIADAGRAHFCGGSVYDSRWIVTAAHCMKDLIPAQIHVVAGTNVLTRGAYRINVSRIIRHASYDPKSKDNDVALLQTAEPLPLGSLVRSIGLMSADDEVKLSGKNLLVTGWGATEQGGVKVRDLREVDVPYVTNEACNDFLSYDGRVTANMLCAGRAAGGVDSCQGDSGGPLTLKTGSTSTILAGIVSWGRGCAQPGKYGVYARVSRYKAWVENCTKAPSTC
jgi:secreted trypsin-like serine protease